MINDILFPESMEKTEGLDAQEVLKIHDDYIRYIVERVRFAFNGYSNKRKFIEAIEDVVEDGPLAKELENEKSAREQAIDRMNEKIDGAGGLYTTVDPDTGIVYMHDKKEEPGTLPPFRESRNVIQISTAGIFVSNDGGVTWPMGFTLEDGEAILNKIYAIGIDANYIKANTLSADKIEATEKEYPNSTTWDITKVAVISSYLLGRISIETALAMGADVNGDGEVNFLDLAMCYDAIIGPPWNPEGGTYKAQIKCENGFNAISVIDGEETAFNAGIHGMYARNAYIGKELKLYDKDDETDREHKMRINKDGIYFNRRSSYPTYPADNTPVLIFDSEYMPAGSSTWVDKALTQPYTKFRFVLITCGYYGSVSTTILEPISLFASHASNGNRIDINAGTGGSNTFNHRASIYVTGPSSIKLGIYSYSQNYCVRIYGIY